MKFTCNVCCIQYNTTKYYNILCANDPSSSTFDSDNIRLQFNIHAWTIVIIVIIGIRTEFEPQADSNFRIHSFLLIFIVLWSTVTEQIDTNEPFCCSEKLIRANARILQNWIGAHAANILEFGTKRIWCAYRFCRSKNYVDWGDLHTHIYIYSIALILNNAKNLKNLSCARERERGEGVSKEGNKKKNNWLDTCSRFISKCWLKGVLPFALFRLLKRNLYLRL